MMIITTEMTNPFFLCTSARNFTSEMATVATSIHSFTSTFRSLYSPPTAIFPTSIFQLRLQPSSPILRSIVSIKCRVDGANTSHFTALGKNVRSFGIVSALGKISETEMVPVPEETEGNLPDGSGIYGIYDSSGELQFIGITRNIAASVASHRKKVPDLCFSVKVGLMDEPTPDRTVLTDAWKSWMQEHLETTGKVPPGNESGNNTWMRPQKKPDLRLTRGRHVKLSLPLEDLIDQLVKEKKIVTFIKGSRSSPQCGFSQRVVGILESQGVDFECVNILDEEHNFGLRETLKTYSNWPTFPQIFLNGELLGGCDILCAMEEKGELSSLLEK